jgi:hypothetical protein
VSKRFLNKLHKDLTNFLEKDENLRKFLNFNTHEIIFSRNNIQSAIVDQLNFRRAGEGIKRRTWADLPDKNKERILKGLQNEIDEAMSKIHSKALNLQKEYSSKEDVEIFVWPASSFNPRRTPYIKATFLIPRSANIKKKFGGTLSSFDGIRSIYDSALKDVYKYIEDEIEKYKKSLKRKKNRTSKEEEYLTLKEDAPFAYKGIALGHTSDTVVAKVRESRVDQEFNKLLKAKGLGGPDRKVLIKDFGFEVFLEWKSEIDTSKLSLIVESYDENASKGKGEAAGLAKRRAVLKALQKRLENSDLGRLKGSDTRVEIESKKIIGSFEGAAKEGKHLKKTKSDTKPELSRYRSKPRRVKATVTPGTKNVVKPPERGTKKFEIPGETRNTGQSAIALLALINSKLPETVIRNMQPPRLQNRTGRFAGSVRATDIISTRQGYPSIGYTYQRNPYETFEVGGRQGTTDRDPRKLIDASIREIAAELLVGRFYTRRV